MSRIAGRFTRVEPRRRARQLVLGLLSDLPRKNCWTIAEWAGERTPDGMQHLLGRAKWDADRVRDDVCDYVVDHLHDDQAVLVVDLCRHSDYAEGPGLGLAGQGSWLAVLGIVTGLGGTRGSCRWGGSGQVWPVRGL
jgi:hypothetical protein